MILAPTFTLSFVAATAEIPLFNRPSASVRLFSKGSKKLDTGSYSTESRLVSALNASDGTPMVVRTVVSGRSSTFLLSRHAYAFSQRPGHQFPTRSDANALK